MDALPTLQATVHPALDGRVSERVTKANRLGDLQAFQARIAQKIADAQSSTQQAQSMLAVQIGAYGVLIPLSDMSNLLAMPELSPVPLAKQWLKGLAVVRAEVLTVLDLAYCLNAYLIDNIADWALIVPVKDSISSPSSPAVQAAQAKLLVLSALVQNQLAVTVDKVVGIIAKDTLTIHSSNHVADGVVLRQLMMDVNGAVFIELSLAELLKSTSFLKLTY
jgi:chemotaxis signal transduction protein